MTNVLVTCGAGFVGSHVAEYYAQRADEVVVYDILSRGKLLGYANLNVRYNWNYLTRYETVRLVQGDIRDTAKLNEAADSADILIHTAAQTAVTTSVQDPRTDFEVNALGTFAVLEVARQLDDFLFYGGY